MNIVTEISAVMLAARKRPLKPVKDWTTPEEWGGTDSAAIQAAINTGLTVVLANSYTISATCDITTKTGQAFTGGGTVRLDDSRPVGTQMFNLDTANGVSFTGLKFDGNKANQTQPPANNSWNSGLPRAYYSAINMEHSSNVAIKNCEFYDTCTCPINFYDCENVTFSLNYFHDCYMDAIFTNLEDEVSNISRGVLVEWNLIERMTYLDSEGVVINAYANGMIVDANDLVIRYNTIDTVDRSGMKPADVSRSNILIEYNTIRNCGWAGINPQSGSDITIRHNQITDVGTIGVSVSPISQTEVRSNLTIEDNTIIRAGFGSAAGAKAGIFATGGTTGGITNVTIQRNTITDCHRFGLYVVSINDSFVVDNDVTNSTIYNIYIDGTVANHSDTVEISDNTLVGSTYGLRVENFAQDLTIGINDISGTSESAIYLNAPDGTTIIDNTIDDVDGNGIWIVEATNTTIDNNGVSNCANSGVLVSSAGTQVDGLLIKNNDFDTITQYGLNILGTPTNVTVEANNTYTNIGIADVNWPDGP